MDGPAVGAVPATRAGVAPKNEGAKASQKIMYVNDMAERPNRGAHRVGSARHK